MARNRLSELLDHTNGRQRRLALLAILGIALVVAVITAYGNSGAFSLTGKNTPGLKNKRLRVATHVVQYADKTGLSDSTDIELALIEHYAEANGWELSILRSRDRQHSLDLLRLGDADVAITGTIEPFLADELASTSLSVTTTREVTLQLIGLQGPAPAPFSLADVGSRPVGVGAGSPVEKQLERLGKRYPNLTIDAWQRVSGTELLEQVMDTSLQYAVVQSDEFLILQHFYPDLISRLELPGLFPVGWVIRTNSVLFQHATDFIRQQKATGEFQTLVEKHQEHFWDFNYSEATAYLQAIETTLPEFEPLFQSAADDFDLDWRLLAAMAYQESHWDPEAQSHTGVRGIMMLTRAAAQDMQVTNRLDAAQSIHGGTRYLARMLRQLPDGISSSEQLWFALASYNIGAGHLQDAMTLADSLGDDPLQWQHLKHYLPLLSDPEWYEKTRYGAARGHEPVNYVRAIRRYYDILIWITHQHAATQS